MNDLAFDNAGDLLIEDYDISFVSGVDQIVQNLAFRLRFFLGEWYLDTEAGIPYYQDFFIKAPNQIRVESVLKQEILNTEGIVDLTAFSSDFNSSLRKFSVIFSASTNEGIINLEVEVP
jgi:hypothetical protein